MGYYKKLWTEALFGDKESMKAIAKTFEAKGELKQAIKWYGDVGDSSKVKELTRRLEDAANSRREEESSNKD